MSDKKIFFKIRGVIDADYLIIRLDQVNDIIKADLECYEPYKDELPTYNLEPVYLTEEEFNELPEFNG